MPRMFCVDCGATDVAVTRLPGSDRREALAWLAGGAPGWIYCAWRHGLREKRCAHCGGDCLIRETRASAARLAFAPAPARIEAADGPTAWPAPLGAPRARLRRPVVALAAALALVWAPLARRAWAPRCEAWDAAGRELRIELV